MNTPKRFIAGAICPSCKELDKLMMWTEDHISHRECVACGFADTLNEQGLSVPKELPTRVSLEEAAKSVEAKPIHFFPNPKLKQPH